MASGARLPNAETNRNQPINGETQSDRARTAIMRSNPVVEEWNRRLPNQQAGVAAPYLDPDADQNQVDDMRDE